MDAVPQNLEVMAWFLGAIVTFVVTFVGAAMAYFLRNFLKRVEEVFVRVAEHDVKIAEHEVKLINLIGGQ